MLAAYILGVEIATRLGSVAKGGFHQIGFHPTGLIGAFGAVGAGWLLGLNEAQQVDAQGIALSGLPQEAWVAMAHGTSACILAGLAAQA